MTGSEIPTPSDRTNERTLTKGTGLINGTWLTNGSGMKNGTSLTQGIGLINGTGLFQQYHQIREQGLTNGNGIKEPSGLEVRADLINGLSIKPKGVLEDSPCGWGRSARKRRAVRRALMEKDTVPMPGKVMVYKRQLREP